MWYSAVPVYQYPTLCQVFISYPPKCAADETVIHHMKFT